MKTLKLFLLVSFASLFSATTQAQSSKNSFPVSGNCGMCKSKIETAAKSAGATYASWDEETKILSVRHEAGATSKIQTAIAAAGYDTPTAKATAEAYNKLHACCKYERTIAGEDTAQAASPKTAGPGAPSLCSSCSGDKECCKNGTCVKQECAQAGAKDAKKDCCKKS